MAGLAWSVLDDRERYRMLKYLYISPNSLLVVLLGRGTARIAIAGMGAVITLAIGVAVPGRPVRRRRRRLADGDPDAWRSGWWRSWRSVSPSRPSASRPGRSRGRTRRRSRAPLFLVVGAVFPLLVLPAIAQVCGLLLPLTWWLEGVRRALFPGTVSAIGGTRIGVDAGHRNRSAEQRGRA